MRDWTPRLQPGGVYCSPSCGCRCTWADFEWATAQAKVLAERLGDGWRPHVHENGGWWWLAVKGQTPLHAGLAEVHPRTGADRRTIIGYSAWINPATEGVAQVITDTVADPVEALGLAMQEARTRSLRFSGELDTVCA
jgi:hypothetical protein